MRVKFVHLGYEENLRDKEMLINKVLADMSDSGFKVIDVGIVFNDVGGMNTAFIKYEERK